MNELWHDRIVRRVDVRESWRRAKKDFAAVKAERDHLRAELVEANFEIDRLNAALREVRLTLRELRDAVRTQDWAEARARKERDEAVDQLLELRAIVDARQLAEERLTELHREREIVRARAAERAPGQLLH